MSSPSGYHRGPGIYFDAIGEAWKLVLKDPGHWIAATILYFVINWVASIPGALISALIMPRSNDPSVALDRVLPALAIQFTFGIIPFALTQVIFVGMISMGVRKTRGEYINVGMIFEPFSQFGRILSSSLLMAAVVLASALACFFPVFFFGPVLTLMSTVAYLRGLNATESLTLTFNTFKPYWAGLFGLLFITGIVTALGICACGVGILITFPMYCVVLAIHYRAFFETGPSAPVYAPGA